MDSTINKSWKKVFYIISAGQAFSLLGSSMVQFAIIWWLTVKTNSALVLSAASIAGFLPQAIFGPFIGALVDRYSRKTIMIMADITIAAATLVLIAFFYMGEPSIWIIYLVLAVRSLGSAFHIPAMQASIPLLVPEESLTSAAGVTQLIQSASYALGPALAAFMLGLLSIEHVMMIDVAGAAIATITLFIVAIPNPERSTENAENTGMLKEISHGIKALTGYKGLFYLTVISSLYTIIYIPVGSLFPLMVRRHFQGGAFHASAVEVAFAAGMIGGSIVLGVVGDKLKKTTAISISICMMGIALIFSGVLPGSGFIAFAGLSAVMGLSAPMFSGAYMALIQSKIDPGVLGRVMGVINSMMLVATPLGLLIAGPGAELLGVSKWFLLSGVLIGVLGLLSFSIHSIKSIEV